MKFRLTRKLDKYLGYFLIAILLPFTRLLGIMLQRDHSADRPPKKILFIKLLGLGSLVVAADPIQSMKERFPSSKFILLADRNIAKGIEPFCLFDEIWTINMKSFISVFTRGLHCILQSWQVKDLWVVDLEVYSKMTTVYSLMTMARNRFGFILPQSFFRKFLNTHNIIFDKSVPLEDNYISLAEKISNKNYSSFSKIPGRKNEDQLPYIVLNNTCSELAFERKLPDSTFAEVCKWILENTNYQVAIAGSPPDKPLIDSFTREYFHDHSKKDKIRNIAGTFEFESYYRFLSDEAVCLVTIDSGPLHIARKLGLPTISVWGPTDPNQYLKIVGEQERKRHLYLFLKVLCSPCVHIHEKLPCGGDNICMKNIQSGEMIRMIETLLNHLKERDLPDAEKSHASPLIGKIDDRSAIH